MKKILFTIFLLTLYICAFSETHTISNEKISISFQVYENNNINLQSIKSKETDFIKENIKDKSLWSFIIKKSNDYGREEINLLPNNAEFFKSQKSNNNIKFYWHNVKTEAMVSGFNVTVNVSLSEENSYWTINISPNKEYGIWTVTFPRINDINAEEGNELVYPYNYGSVIKEFSDPKGFPALFTQDKSVKAPDMGFISPANLQLFSFTQNNKTLYFSTEDSKGSMKSYNINLFTPNHLDLVFRNFVENMAKGGIGYTQSYKFNMAIINGDWYNAAKKYRNWCQSNSPIFKQGPIEYRKDIPDWLKNNTCWLHYHGFLDDSASSIIASQKFLSVPCAVHCYSWSKYEFDSHYPNFLPEKDFFKEHIKRMQDAGIHVMPYTNGHLVDINQSDYYKQYGNEILSMDEKGEYYSEDWAKDLGADNKVCCINSNYYKAYLTEAINMLKELNFDAFYIDQLGGSPQHYCFNPKHRHNMGGGHTYISQYTKLVNELKETLSKIKGAPIPIATEGANEFIPMDLWLCCNDFSPQGVEYPLQQVIYSGYVINFGDLNHIIEWSENNSIAAMNKTAYSFISGHQIGWAEGGDYEFDKYPTFGKFFKNTAKARESHNNYFNFGELMRPVKFTNNIPTKEIFMRHYTGDSTQSYKLVKTGSFNYKGSVLIAFTNISEEPIQVHWESDNESLGLVKKDSYTISKVYPTKSNEILSKSISGTLTIKGLETVLLLIE